MGPRLAEAIEALDVDVLSLVELDHFHGARDRSFVRSICAQSVDRSIDR